MLGSLIKRSLILAALVGAALVCLAGCARGGGGLPKLDPKNPVTVTVWHYYHGAQKTAFDGAVNEFNATLGYEMGIIVEAVGHGGVDELAANVMSAAKNELDAGELPSVFGSYGDTALEVLDMGLAAAIDEYLTPEELAEYEDSFLREGMLGTDHLYVFPIAKSTESLMLNKTAFDAFTEGLAAARWDETADESDLSTWEGILRVADLYYRYTDALTPDLPNDGKAFMGIDSVANYLIVGSKQLGQDLIAVRDGRVELRLDEEIMETLWNTYYKPFVTGRFIKLGRFCSDDVKTGDSISYIGSTSSATYFPTEIEGDEGEKTPIEMAALPMPCFEGGDRVAISQGAGMVVAKSSPEKEYASVVFLRWFTESERNVSFSLASSYLPVKRASLDDALLAEAFLAIEADNAATQNTIKTLKVGIRQLRDYALYTSEVFPGGAEFRAELPILLTETVRADAAAWATAVQGGADPSETYERLLEHSEERRAEWLESLRKWGT